MKSLHFTLVWTPACAGLSLLTPDHLRKYLTVLLVAVILIYSAIAKAALYGIVSEGTDVGQLVTIDPATGNTALVGDTGLTQPFGLAYNPSTGLLYTINNIVVGMDQVYSIDTETGAAMALSSPALVSDPLALAYSARDDYFYTSEPEFDSGSKIVRLDSLTGTRVGLVVGFVSRPNLQALAVRDSDYALFGAGGSAPGESIFRIPILGGAPGRDIETDIHPTGRVINALSFSADDTLYASDGDNLVTIDPADGSVTTIGPFLGADGTVGGLAFVPDSDGAADVWIKDCRDDMGNPISHPAPCAEYWTSTDIWIDNDDNWEIDAPLVGVDNHVKAFVRNRGGSIARDVEVAFYYRDNATGLIFPDGANLIGMDTVTVSPDTTAVASVIWEDLPPPPDTGGHWCIGVVLNHPEDSVSSPTVQPWEDNNIGIANLWFIAARAGHSMPLPFYAGSGGQPGFGLTPWPREFRLDVIDRLPEGWAWGMEGINAGENFTLKLGEQRKTVLTVIPSDVAVAHSGGYVEVQQVDLDTGRIVGGVRYDLYEDHRPPARVEKVTGILSNGKALLSWQPVISEAETGLRERVAYYQVFRDGKALTKVVRDTDPHQPGIQWADSETPEQTAVYTIQAVDEGGNAAALSDEIIVVVPEQRGLFNWLTLILLILLGVVIYFLVKQYDKNRA
ncbi:hypothetical protein [Neptunomonas qingdaonensis]|uniref:Uncharacterized protein n=1 Tax=Neptunomonas qingdaonensis TaxID=1045558 RepID=A0A1I2URV2_9GAMM|nr:hypothetical protein [Neptunomonas qingdaonensis]SFG79740.1 hypothetical protein SAMN05216175_1147 [Neptunomonas qingdaonensis]